MRYADVFVEYGDLTEKERSSPYYRMTHDPRDPDSDLKWQQLRAQIKQHNKENPDDQQDIVRRGRRGPDNPHSYRYRRGGDLSHLAVAGNVRPDHAAHFDVYVKPRRRGWW